jgi:hypothetical protein
MASSKDKVVYAAVETGHPAEDIPVAETIGMESVEVRAPCDLPEGYDLSVEMQGKKTVVAVVCMVHFHSNRALLLDRIVRGHVIPCVMWADP